MRRLDISEVLNLVKKIQKKKYEVAARKLSDTDTLKVWAEYWSLFG